MTTASGEPAARVADEPPRWRRGYDAIEPAVTTRVEQVVGSDQFAQAVTTLLAVRRHVEQRTGRLSRRVLHGFNLPAGTDIGRLLTEIGELRKQMRHVAARLDELEIRTDAPSGVGRGGAGH